MAILAPKPVSRCPRCYSPIAMKAPIEPIGTDSSGGRIWAHVGCKNPADRASVQPARPVTGDDDDDMDDDTPTPAAPRPITGAGTESRAILTELIESALPNLARRVQGNVVGELNRQIGEFTREGRTTLEGAVAKIDVRIDEAAASIRQSLLEVAKSVQRTCVTIKMGDIETVADADEVFNEVFAEVLDLLATGENVFLPGPTGCGKTHLCEQIAKYIPNADGTFGRQFGMITGSGGVTETEVKGVATPNITTGENVYLPSRFVELYEEGGVFLVDEADAMDPNVLLAINSAISNGFMSIPKRMSKPMARKHKDFVILFAANTYGSGADRVYVGRNKLDGSTMDRFVYVPVDYDRRIERKLCPDDSLFGTLMMWRRKIMEARLSRILSTRFVAFAYRWRSKGLAYIAKKLTKDRGWTLDEMRKVIGEDLIRQMDQ